MIATDAAVDRLDQAVAELKRLRQGQGLARPSAVLQLDLAFRELVLHGAKPVDTADEINRLVVTVRTAIDDLDEHQCRYASVDFNLDQRHAYPTLTERQASLASELRCASKTVRRQSDRALETLALALVTADRNNGRPPDAVHLEPPPLEVLGSEKIARLRAFLGLPPGARVDIVCSEMPPDERPAFADPQDRNYLRYAKFADLDSLIFVHSRLVQLFPDIHVRDFSPSEYFDTSADALFVLGGPPWNATFRQFQAQLPFSFEPHPLGQDDPLVVPLLGDKRFGPSWVPGAQLAGDIAVLVRLTMAGGMRVFLAGGCLTLGVLAASKCFLHGERGGRNAEVVTELVGARDFVLVSEATRIGGITDVADLASTGPLLLLVRTDTGRFEVAVDNSERHQYAVANG